MQVACLEILQQTQERKCPRWTNVKWTLFLKKKKLFLTGNTQEELIYRMYPELQHA